MYIQSRVWHAILSYPNLITGPRCNLLLQIRLWEPSHSGITVSSTLEKMHEHNQPTTRITSQETSILSQGNFEYLQVWNTTYQHSVWNGRIFLHRKIWDICSGASEDLCLRGCYSVSTGIKSYWHLGPPQHLNCQGKAVRDSLTICQSTWHSIQEPWIFVFMLSLGLQNKNTYPTCSSQISCMIIMNDVNHNSTL